jgi:hypothetical protein
MSAAADASRRVRRKASFVSGRPADANLTTLYRTCASPQVHHVFLAISTFINNSGRCDPGQRAISVRAREIVKLVGEASPRKRDGLSPAMVNRHVRTLAERGLLTMFDRGGDETLQYQVSARYLCAALELRQRLSEGWGQFWRRSSTGGCFTDEAEGEAGSINHQDIHTPESLSPRAREDFCLNQSLDTEGSATASPDGIKVSASQETTEPPSDALLHPRDAAVRFKSITTGRQRKRREPQGPALRAQKLARHDQINTLFLETVDGPEAARRYVVAMTQHPDTAERMRCGVRDRRRAAYWKPPKGALPDFDPFNSRSRIPPSPSPEERERRKNLLFSKIVGYLRTQGRPGAEVEFVERMLTLDPVEAQRLFDTEAARLKRSGWDDIPWDWYRDSGITPPSRTPPPVARTALVDEFTPEEIAAAEAEREAMFARNGWFHGGGERESSSPKSVEQEEQTA